MSMICMITDPQFEKQNMHHIINNTIYDHMFSNLLD